MPAALHLPLTKELRMHSQVRCFCLALLSFAMPSLVHADSWIAPSPEELSMTAEPQAPGAPAIYLNREEITDDHLHMWRKYARIKVLTEGGKDLANVEVEQVSSSDYGGYKIIQVAGRTIHPDGTVIPFTGAPYEKLLEKSQGLKVVAKVFTLPAVEVGSIIEYRYELSYDDNLYIPPSWIIQSDLFTRHAHYLWLPTNNELISKDEKGEQITSGIAWSPLLPKGAELKKSEMPSSAMGGTTLNGPQYKFELTMDAVPPQPQEEHMPPIHSLGYRVLFFYTPYRSQADFWKESSNRWSKARDKFIGPGPHIQAAVTELVQPKDTDEQKLRKIYAAVLKLDNTRFSRQHSTAEEHAQGLGEIKTADDVWERKRGTDDQLAELFVAMARAAGMKAYVMAVTNRDTSVFLPSYMTLSQLNDLVAIVNVGGKEQFFDPGQAMCPYGQLAWKHTTVQGIRQVDGGGAIDSTPFVPYKESRTDRVADLVMDEHGEASGPVKMTFRGAPALNWRQRYLRGDETSLHHDLERMLEAMLPGSMDVKVHDIQNLEDYEQPLVVTFDVKGVIATATGKRMIVPGDIFEFTAKPTFTLAKREQAVYFPYTYSMLDAVRVKFPAGFAIESSPQSKNLPFAQKEKNGNGSVSAVYDYKTETTANSVTVRRNLMMGDIVFPVAEYPNLHTFFTSFEAQDHEPTVITIAAQAASN